MKVSVIIPIYNGEKYIYDMYESLKNQTFQDFEIIYVNDGSSDNSKKILDEIKKKDSRVYVVSQVNKGICASRNVGIKVSSGEYIIFLDQDDGIEPNLVEKYYTTIVENDVDIASFGKIHYFVDENGKITDVKPMNIDEELVTSRRRLIECLFNIDNKKRLMTIWNCIYKRSLIEKNTIRFDEHFKHGDEDGMFNMEYALHCDRVYFSKESYYHYYIRKGKSTITKYNEELLDNYLYYADKVYGLTKNFDEQDGPMVKLYLLRMFSNVYGRFCRFHNKNAEKIEFIQGTIKSEGFRYATSLSVLHNRKCIPQKYIMWDFFNLVYKHRKYRIATVMLNLLLVAKAIKN